MSITDSSMVRQIRASLGVRADEFDVDAIWQDIWDVHYRVDISTIDQDWFRQVCVRHFKGAQA